MKEEEIIDKAYKRKEIQKEGLCHNQFFYSIYDELYYEMR